MGSKVKKVVKKVTKPIKKVIKSPIGQVGLAVALPQFGFISKLGSTITNPFLQGALRSGVTSALISGLSGRGIDPKRTLASAVLGGGVTSLEKAVAIINNRIYKAILEYEKKESIKSQRN